MADTAVAITAGVGTNVDTRTEATNGNHRQVVVLGDPSVNAGVAPVDATNGLAIYNVQALTVASHAVTNAGTFAVQATLAAETTKVIGTVNIASAQTLATVTTVGTVTTVSTVSSVTAVGTITPGTAATSLGKAEDAAHTSGDVGVMALAVRNDTAAALAGTTGDYIPLTTDDLGNLRVHIDDRQLDGSEYETVAASQTTQTLGATGATGDYLREVLVIPATTSPGNIQIKDGVGSAITVFTGGASSVSNLVPFTISLGLTSTAGAWQLTTGSNVSAIGIGNFT